MPAYQLSNVRSVYQQTSNTPRLDRVVFTLDHIHGGHASISSTKEVVRCLTARNIPVVVFFQNRNPANPDTDKQDAQEIYALAPHLVSLGVHSLSKGNSQAKQRSNLDVLNGVIKDITGKKSQIMSYHGAGAGPEPGIHYPGIKYARGIQSAWAVGADNPLETPVMPLNNVSRAFEYTQTRNAAGLTATLFVHTGELAPGSVKRRVFDTFVKEVQARRLQAMHYFQAMESDFRGGANRPTDPNPDHSRPPAGGNNGGTTTDNGPKGSFKLSASSDPARRPIKADFQIKNSRGQQVAGANHVHTQMFRLPVGQYTVSAKRGNASKSKRINLTAAGGIHEIFLLRT